MRRYGSSDKGPAWEPMDDEKPLANYELPTEVPDAATVRDGIVLPEVPRELPGAARLLEQLRGSLLTPGR